MKTPQGEPESAKRWVDFGQLTAAEFEPLLHSKFQVDLSCYGLAADGDPIRRDDVYPSGAELNLELVEVTPGKRLGKDAPREPFVLLFLGGHELPLLGNVHVLEHESIGRFALMLSPVNVSFATQPEHHPEGRFYESCIN